MNPKIFSASVLALALPLIAAAAGVSNLPAKDSSTATQTPPRVASSVTPSMASSTNPGLTVAPTKITSIQVSSTKLMAGMPLVVKVNGTGMQQYCASSIVIDQLTPTRKNDYGGLSSFQAETGGWPRKKTFNLSEEGTYQVRILLSAGSSPSCGYHGEGSIPGDLTKIEILSAVAK